MIKKERAWIEVNRENLKNNVNELKKCLREGCEIMAVVKANAYGHGDILVSRELNRLGIYNFAVATLTEAIRLRQKKIEGNILVLGYTSPREAKEIYKYDIIQTIIDDKYAKELDESGYRVRAHVKIDTGMHRLGEDSHNLLGIQKIFSCKNLQIEGTYTHLCVADSQKEEDILYTGKQIEQFYQVIDALKKVGYQPGKIHIQSSYGVLNYPDLPVDYVRVGIALYGNLSSIQDRVKKQVHLEPVLSLKSRVAQVRAVRGGENAGYGRAFTAKKDGKLAVITIGYGDGLPRELSGKKAKVMIRGEKIPIVGRICMDQLLADVSGVQKVEMGDEVILIGRDGKKKIKAEEVAEEAGTITNELLCRLGDRLERILV
jgi:serine/alanine racemase